MVETEGNSNINNKNTATIEDILGKYDIDDNERERAIEEAEVFSRKAMLCGIIEQVNKDKENERFDVTFGFRGFLRFVGEILDEFPEITETYCSGLSYETDRQGVMLVIGLYLAYRRIKDRRQARNKNLFNIHEVLDEAESINRDNYEEMNDLTRLMYGLLQCKYGRDRITPLILEMSKDAMHQER